MGITASTKSKPSATLSVG